MPGKRRKVLTPAEQYLDAFETAVDTINSSSEMLAEAEDEVIEILKEAKTTLPNGEFRNFWNNLNFPEHLLAEIEDALGEVDEQPDRDDDEGAD
jgi:hypothetical protein